MFLIYFCSRKVVSILIALSITELCHRFRGSISQMEGNCQISVFLDISFGLLSDFVGEVGFWGFGEIEGKLKKENFALRHSDFLHRIKNLIGKQKSIIVCRTDIFASKTKQSPRKIKRILASSEHSLNPVTRRISIAITKRLMHCGNNRIMLLAITIVIKLLGTCLYQEFRS